MQQDSVWLGPLRKPVQMAMIGFSGLTIALFIFLVFNQFISSDAIGMHDMIRPQGKPIVTVTLFSLALALLFTALFLSDDKGTIEVDRTGPFDILSLVCARLAMMSIAYIVIVMFYEVVSRYVFNQPTMWANELSLWIASFLFLLAGLYAMQQRSHIRIYVIYDMMPRWMQKAADCVSVFLIWVFTFCLVWGGYNDAMRRMLRMETFGTAWDPPIPGTVKPAILFIIVLVAIQALSNLIADWNKAPEHHNPADEIDEHEIEALRRTLEEDKK
ncbi:MULTISPECIES: TRAP transporter small permease subunit [Mameliella]|uniref:TRAP transporter small permease protein n=1 Tax=Mameliella alba TaxID=561184 RepID=A0A0B3RUX0_9RHOB|nr:MULTISPECIES: TRAP transporter small permease [Mameliella]MBV6636699.1 TRAP transporter small permease [Mameliella sp.]MCR9273771.1 TRAP transporter small permease [Paracoccaceae bacterium]ODM47574.1 C4-dicarboxylate ABC transporter substrate-binding protein [Ruegeria sp. PBVC088]KHQ51882.1 C4-dicarboxylate ABC transporter substrate-binding protein [Mameliella alba]MBY6122385.1 TRAP transporter small permease [Mameliella alba]